MNPNHTPAYPRLRAYSDALILAFVGLVAALVLALAAMAVTGTALDFETLGSGDNANQPNNIADVLHPNIHANNGTGNNANPGVGNDNGNNRHGIANNPGQSGNEPGVANLANVHGGIGCKNKNVAQPAGGCG